MTVSGFNLLLFNNNNNHEYCDGKYGNRNSENTHPQLKQANCKIENIRDQDCTRKENICNDPGLVAVMDEANILIIVLLS